MEKVIHFYKPTFSESCVDIIGTVQAFLDKHPKSKNMIKIQDAGRIPVRMADAAIGVNFSWEEVRTLQICLVSVMERLPIRSYLLGVPVGRLVVYERDIKIISDSIILTVILHRHQLNEVGTGLKDVLLSWMAYGVVLLYSLFLVL